MTDRLSVAALLAVAGPTAMEEDPVARFFQFSALLALFGNVFITLLVLFRGQRLTVSRVYFLWGASMSIWNLGSFFMFQVPKNDSATALFWAHFVQFGVILIPISNLHLTVLIAQVSLGRLLTVFYALYAGLLVSLFTGHFVEGVRYIGYKWYSVPGPFFRVYTGLYLVTTTLIMTILWRKQRALSGLHRTRLRSLIVAFSILLVLGTNDLLPIMGIDHYPVLGLKVYPLGLPGAILYGLIVGYSVLQHQLLDIHVHLSRVAAHIVRVSFALLSGFVLLLVSSLFVNYSPGAFACALGAILASALLTTAFFPQFLGKGEEALERRLLGDRFAYHDRIREFIQTLQSRPDSQALIPELQDLFAGEMRLASFQIILLDETTRNFTLFHSHPEQRLRPLPEWSADSPLFRYFQTPHPGYLACKIAYSMPGETPLERAARQQLKPFDPEFCFPFFSEREIFGMLLIGSKANGDPFTRHDLRLLSELVQNLGLLLNQVRLKNQILAAQEQELLGRMSRGLAHDLNNLLTPVQTFLQLCSQGLLTRESLNELLPVALRNIETVRAYVNEALFFSRTHRLDLRPCRLDETIRRAVDEVEPRARPKNIQFRLDGLAPLIVEIDEVMIHRLLTNLMANAIDASPVGATVQVHLLRLPRTEASRDWIRLKVMDAGEGISRENLERVFTPYFTTKDRGDGRRGFGLGLAIARKIVLLHGGNLSIASVEKRGTTVQVDLPSRQSPPEREPKPQPAQTAL